MGILSRSISSGIRRGISKAVGDAVSKAIEPTATNFANMASEKINGMSSEKEREERRASSSFEGALKSFEKAAVGYATEISKNLKACPSCGNGVDKNRRFCPGCGTELPEYTVSDETLCAKCGTQNDLGTRFCDNCGEKLPGEIAREKRQRETDELTLSNWTDYLARYPKWECGGIDYNIEAYGNEHVTFTAEFETHIEAKNAIDRYWKLLLDNGFRAFSDRNTISKLYRKEDGKIYSVDSSMAFESSHTAPTIEFSIKEEPIEIEKKKKSGLRSLFSL